jgi:aminomethyltransferase
MGQCKITGEDATAQFERFVPGDYEILKAGKQKYSLLLNKDGGIIDDLMAGRPDHDGLFVVVNAGNKDEDFAFWSANLEGDAKLTVLDRALIAIQGPEAAEVMAAHEPILAEMGFMECARLMLFGVDCYVSRSGYTGEDGYEISVPADQAERVWNTILEDARVKPIGLGARDSLRLEAGLPLHGHDIDPTTSPVEGALTFALSILKELADGPSRIRIGLIVKEGAPAREGAEIADADGNVIGKVTSGGPSPTLGKNIAMGFVPPAYAALGTELKVVVRGKSAAAEVVAMPFVAQRYYRKPKA